MIMSIFVVLRSFNVSLSSLNSHSVRCLILCTAFIPQAAGINYSLVSSNTANLNLGMVTPATSFYQTLTQPTVYAFIHVVGNIQKLFLSC